jgi:hypothetical protein
MLQTPSRERFGSGCSQNRTGESIIAHAFGYVAGFAVVKSTLEYGQAASVASGFPKTFDRRDQESDITG